MGALIISGAKGHYKCEAGLVCKVSFRPARVSRSNHLGGGGQGANYKFNTKDYFIYIGNNNRKDQKELEPEDINIKLNKGDREGEGRRKREEQGETDRHTDRSV